MHIKKAKNGVLIVYKIRMQPDPNDTHMLCWSIDRLLDNTKLPLPSF